MKKKLLKKYIQAIEGLGWNVHIFANEIEIENWSPAGENIVDYFQSGTDIATQARELADNYDADEHAEMWVAGRGKNGVPSSIRVLINDADAIGKMYETLADKLERVKEDEQ